LFLKASLRASPFKNFVNLAGFCDIAFSSQQKSDPDNYRDEHPNGEALLNAIEK
jgi:hypothetical protein